MRKSGILLPIFSLPSSYGIGCFDKEAYQFVDKLAEAKQTYWQILPLGLTGYGDSPYQSFSTYAGNPYFIDLNELCEKGWLSKDLLPVYETNTLEINYTHIYNTRYKLLKSAYLNSDIKENKNFIQWCNEESWWLDDYALFMAIKDHYNGISWNHWPKELRLRDKLALEMICEELMDKIEYYQFLQYVFWNQWNSLKQYANSKGIQIIGDIPIYVAFDSADVWANPELFQLDENRNPSAVAGCPPDGFSADGQLWGNPLYRWNAHKEQNYAWWVSRMKYCAKKYDVVRIDHFRGFDEYYSIPYGETTARNGHWEKGPGYDLFESIENQLGELNVIAEDLGFVTESMKKLVEDCGYPGMKVFQFAFDSRDENNALLYLPENYTSNSVVYPGTHDNETMMGWLSSIKSEEKQTLKQYLKTNTKNDEELLDICIETIMHSVSDICIIPMQDWLKLDNSSRINTPSTLGTNWKWRMNKDLFSEDLIAKIQSITIQSNR